MPGSLLFSLRKVDAIVTIQVEKNFKNSDNTSDPSLLLTSWQTFLVPQVIGISIAENGKYS